MRRLRVGAGTVSVPARDRSVEYGLFRTVITRQKALGRLRAGWPGNPSDIAFAKRMDTRVKPAYDEQRWRRPARSRLIRLGSNLAQRSNLPNGVPIHAASSHSAGDAGFG